jgi:hypothetical protein
MVGKIKRSAMLTLRVAVLSSFIKSRYVSGRLQGSSRVPGAAAAAGTVAQASKDGKGMVALGEMTCVMERP